MGYGDKVEVEVATIPDHVPRELVHPLDHWNGADYIANPLGFWDNLRDRFRVFWSPYHGGFWCLTWYEDIHEAFQRPDLFSSRLTNIPGRAVRLLPISLDPPEHGKYRRPLNKPFSPASVDELSSRIRTRCNELIDDVIDAGGCDFHEAVAKPLPTTIFCETLGLPKSEVKQFLEWNYVILHVHGDAEGQERQRKANEELGAYLSELVQERMTNGEGDDIISQLLRNRIDGEPISLRDAVDVTYLLFMAGLDTVTAGLGWCWQFLAEHPEHRQQILDDPSLIPSAIEELLRYHSFVEDSRTVTQDIEFAGVAMKAGDRIMLPTASAGRDERQFPNAHVVDFRREPNRHLAFAAGPHRCLGSHLARAELRIAMEEWHRRIPHYRIPEGAKVEYHGGAVVGAHSLPLEFIKS